MDRITVFLLGMISILIGCVSSNFCTSSSFSSKHSDYGSGGI